MPNVYTFKDFEGSSHRILIDLIRRYAKRGGALLDLGAAGGELGAAVRDHFHRTLGFEYQTDCLVDLRGRFDQALITDLETVKRLPPAADAIVLADVLEHLRDAPAILRLVRISLAPGGFLFVSVPNIANITECGAPLLRRISSTHCFRKLGFTPYLRATCSEERDASTPFASGVNCNASKYGKRFLCSRRIVFLPAASGMFCAL